MYSPDLDADPIFPIITSASQCQGLSVTSLKKNLKMHATVNPSIKLTGTQDELCSRLAEILIARQADMQVQLLLR